MIIGLINLWGDWDKEYSKQWCNIENVMNDYGNLPAVPQKKFSSKFFKKMTLNDIDGSREILLKRLKNHSREKIVHKHS